MQGTTTNCLPRRNYYTQAHYQICSVYSGGGPATVGLDQLPLISRQIRNVPSKRQPAQMGWLATERPVYFPNDLQPVSPHPKIIALKTQNKYLALQLHYSAPRLGLSKYNLCIQMVFKVKLFKSSLTRSHMTTMIGQVLRLARTGKVLLPTCSDHGNVQRTQTFNRF